MQSPGSSSKRNEPRFIVAYQGMEQSFTFLASTAFFKGHEKDVTYSSERHLKDVINHVVDGSVDYGVVALESSSHGSMYGVYDILLNLEGRAWIVGEIGKLEEHCLCAVAAKRNQSSDDSRIAEVFGHPHILECCNEFLDSLDARRAARDLPDLRRLPTTDSVEACVVVAGKGDEYAAAIASAEAAQVHGLQICKTSIGNDRNAETRYVVIARRNDQSGAVHDPLQIAPAPPALGGLASCRVRKASIAVALRNVAGAIFKLSSCFAFRDMNIVRIESRPSSVATQLSCTSALTGRRHWDLIFYVDYEPSDNPAVNLALLSSIREFSLWVHELGCYYAGLQEVEAAPAQWKEIIDVIAH